MVRLRPAARDDRGFVERLVLFLGLSVLSGVLVAGLVLPFAGAAGLVARDSSDRFQELPGDLKTVQLPLRSRILAADGSLLATFFYQNRVYVPLREIAPSMQKALIAIEDSRFYEHRGIDLKGTARALAANLQAGGVTQGGSTLTQQYVKNVLIEAAGEDREAVEAAREQSISRKLQELRYAMTIEETLTKNQILERYLNIAYLGGSAYGVEAAARTYFNTSAKRLTIPQAAMIAGLFQRPYADDPLRAPEAALARRNVVLDRMAQLGYISDKYAAAAKRLKLGLNPRPPQNGCVTSSAPFFCDYVLNVIKNNPTFGKTKAARVNLLLRGGLTIRTTLDPKMQRAAQAAIDRRVTPTNPVATAIAMVQPGTGDIKAMAVSRGFGDGNGKTRVNLAADYAFGNSRGFQGGSTFKPFIMAAALARGIPPSQRFNSPNKVSVDGFENCETGAKYAPYEVSNFGNSAYPSIDMRIGTWRSVNTYYVQLERQVGQCASAAMAEAMGVRRADGSPLERVPSFVLGSQEVSPLTMAEAYATFAARGVHCDSRAVTSIIDRRTKRLAVPERNCKAAMPPAVADTANAILAGVINGPDPGRTGARMNIGRPAAGKTGTTNRNVAVWFVGYTPDLSAAVWVGYPGRSRSLVNITIGGQRIPSATGARVPGPIWSEAMSAALADVPPRRFTAPPRPPAPSPTPTGQEVRVPRVIGMTPEGALARLRDAGLAGRVSARRFASGEPEGRVAASGPGAGATVRAGQMVTLYLSTGEPAQALLRTRATTVPALSSTSGRGRGRSGEGPDRPQRCESGDRGKRCR